MVAALFHPLAIFLFGLATAFLIPIFYRLGRLWLHGAFFIGLSGVIAATLGSALQLLEGGPAFEVLTGGASPPLSINLRMGAEEAFVALSVNIAAFLCVLALWERLRGKYVALLLVTVLVMGINGMIMTRDLFNLFVFLEIVAVGTFGLLALADPEEGAEAAFKYIMATVAASAFFLLGTMLVYNATGVLNIDDLLALAAMENGPLTGTIAVTGLAFVLGCLIVELKPFPANGWGLDVYETAPPGLAAILSVAVSAGLFFALAKLLPLFEPWLGVIAVSGAASYLFSNLIGLKQTRIQRLLGFSSVGQIGLMGLALAMLTAIDAHASIPLVVGGLFINHLLAKAGLFCLAGLVGHERLDQESPFAGRPFLSGLLALFVTAISALPPFPGFWAKWELVMQLAAAGKLPWIAIILLGSLFEAAYMFRWFVRARQPAPPSPVPPRSARELVPVTAFASLLIATGCAAATLAGAATPWLATPLLAGIGLLVIDGLPGRIKAVAMLAVVALAGTAIMPDDGIRGLLAPLLLAGGIVIAAASLYRHDPRPLHFPLVAVLLLAIQALLRSRTGLEFYAAFELVTLATFFLLVLNRRARPHLLAYLMFSLLAAKLLLAGFSIIAADADRLDLAALSVASADAFAGFVLVSCAFLIKAAAVGVHIWLPGTYAEADDDVTALLSGVVSKVAIAGLFLSSYAAIGAQAGLDFPHVLAWIGMATTLAGALLALAQSDFKRLLAFSSMSQLGYIVTAIALMSHLGWVTALYLSASHMMVKGILFLAIAAVILRTGARTFETVGGLWRAMPLTCLCASFALLAMSGLPPLTGFGAKWLMVSAMAEKGWTGLAIAGLVATFLGLWYMARIAFGLFFGPVRHEGVREGPITLLVPQFVLIAGIVILSLFPKLLMEPVSAAIDPQFAATLVWEGQSLETIYGNWDPVPVMIASLLVAAALFLTAFWLTNRGRRRTGLQAFLVFARPLPAALMPPLVTVFWRQVTSSAHAGADAVRRIYTGNGQFYVALVLLYILALTFARTDLSALVPLPLQSAMR